MGSGDFGTALLLFMRRAPAIGAKTPLIRLPDFGRPPLPLFFANLSVSLKINSLALDYQGFFSNLIKYGQNILPQGSKKKQLNAPEEE